MSLEWLKWLNSCLALHKSLQEHLAPGLPSGAQPLPQPGGRRVGRPLPLQLLTTSMSIRRRYWVTAALLKPLYLLTFAFWHPYIWNLNPGYGGRKTPCLQSCLTAESKQKDDLSPTPVTKILPGGNTSAHQGTLANVISKFVGFTV